MLFESGFISRSVKVTDDTNNLIMETKSERFKIASNHDIDIVNSQYHPAMLIMLFQVFLSIRSIKEVNLIKIISEGIVYVV